MNYQEIKELAKEQGISVKKLIALAPQNDPFYTGSRSELIKAEWFANLYTQFGYTGKVHLRRIHYQAVSHTNIPKPDGTMYQNTIKDWQFLNIAAKYARYLDMVSPDLFEDKRNFAPEIFAQWPDKEDSYYQDPEPGYQIFVEKDYNGDEVDQWAEMTIPELPELPELATLPDAPRFDISGYYGQTQQYHIEIWAEKTTINDVVLPLCRNYKMNYVTGKGELSISLVLDFLKRVQIADRPAVILYISDYDPAGLGMPVSIARKIEYFQREYGYEDLDITLVPITLTAVQVANYDLPRMPVKDSDLRKANWIATQGAGQVELDALEALYPGELDKIVRMEILKYYDETLQDRIYNQHRQLDWRLAGERSAIFDEHDSEMDELRASYDKLANAYKETRTRFAEMITEFQAQLDAHKSAMDSVVKQGKEIYGKLSEELAKVDIDLEEEYPLPEPETSPEPEIALYHSERTYLEQLDYYTAHRGN